jgi:hypothetical protein
MEKMEKNSVQTILSISNTDIVTMLIVKQKELLISQLPIIQKEIDEYVDKYKDKVYQILFGMIEEPQVKQLKDSLKILYKVYNPNINFEVSLSVGLEDYAQRICERYLSIYRQHHTLEFKCVEKIKINGLPNFRIEIEEIDERNFIFPSEEQEYSIPFIKEKFITINKKDAIEIEKILNKSIKINNLLRDDKKLRDEIVAKMTAKAISENIQLQGIVKDVMLLE